MAEGSLNAAAKKLARAKSAVSYNIDNLETQLGFALFERDGYRLQPTAPAQALAKRAEQLLHSAWQLQQFADRVADNIEAKLTLSATAIFPLGQLTKHLNSAMKLYPTCEFVFHTEVLSGEKLLLGGQVDLAIMEGLRAKTKFNSKLIARVSLPLVIGKYHPFLDLPKQQQNRENLLSYPQIVLRSTVTDDTISAGIDKEASHWSVSDLATKKHLIQCGLGWGHLPQHLVLKEMKSGWLKVLDWLESSEEQTPIYLAHLKDRPLGRVAQFLWEQWSQQLPH